MKKVILLIMVMLVALLAFTACQENTPEHTHSFGEWSVTKNPTCTEDGTKARYCDCGEKQNDTVPSIGHNFVDGICSECGIEKENTCKHSNLQILAKVEATCSENGLTEGIYCSDCNAVLTEQNNIPAIGHDEYTYDIKDSECNVYNVTECKRNDCDYETRVPTGAINHTLSDWENINESVSGSPCGIDKIFERICMDCSYNERKTESASGHNYSATIISTHSYNEETGVASIGEVKYTCLNHGCDSSYTEYEQHKYTQTVIASTCSNQGYILNTCSCTHSYKSDFTDKLAHTPTEKVYLDNTSEICYCLWTKPYNVICKTCGTTVSSGSDGATEHEYYYYTNDVWFELIAPTASSDGQIGINCKYCTCHYRTQTIPPLKSENVDNYTYSISVYPPTYTTEGTHYYTYKISSQEFVWKVTIPSLSSDWSKGLEFISNKNGTCYVSGIGNCNDQNIVIPEISPSGEFVTGIGDYAFKDCKTITSVTITKNVSYIGNWAFWNCTSLKTAYLGNNVSTMEYGVFGGCTSLQNVYFEENIKLKCINQYTFQNCTSLETFVVHDGVECINDFAFEKCTALKEITIPTSVTLIGSYVFSQCSNLKQINISSIEKWCEIDFSESVFINENIELYLNGELVTEIEKNNKIKKVNDYAFSNYRKLTSINLPESSYIGKYAFSNCYLLKQVYLGESVINIDDYAFYYCKSIETLNIGNGVKKIGNRAFYSCYKINTLEFSNTLESIGDSAFYCCRSLGSVSVGSNVKSIGVDAFYGCTNLIEVINRSNLPIIKGTESYGCIAYYAFVVKNWGVSTIVNYGDYLFYTHNGVNYLVGYVGNDTNIVLPNDFNGNKYEIYQYVFYDYQSIQSITVSKNVSYIHQYAFYNCMSLTDVYYTGTEENWKSLIIENAGNGYFTYANIHFNYFI